MLTGVRIVVLGGDARQLEVIHRCVELDASVSIVGFDTLEHFPEGAVKETLSEQLLSSADVLILPVVGCDDSGNIQAKYASDETTLTLTAKLAAELPEHCTIFTGMAKPYLKEICKQNKVRLIELLDRDDVAIHNSIPTAEGAIMLAIQKTDFTIHNSVAFVLGLGRTGFTMAKTLQGLGADVRVAVRREEDIARASVMGLKPFLTRDLEKHAGQADLIFNTIPSMIITAQILSKMKSKSFIIDLASAPGGTDFRYAEKRGIQALLAPGLPGIVAPKTAGVIIANSIVKLLLGEQNDRGNKQ
ncbi:dipicolinate synthase subunit DpsA [Paenibacillus gallinarum]|uniref:Dipicolinate synthase subunit DpsA n=1 Tax=Paenibacillus gallinarum TaxID=2762232 RepID=A0ABR8SVE0_9BACL|nr:dipicolinate synthase subunit DpsA [Paenibacillus gallinarum]MBD7967273.1 dipicolinate synthase subunit DpsA [Paenibacillus gallinarum]